MENIITKKELNNALYECAITAIKIGIRLRKGQRLMIEGPVETHSFAKICAKAAYDCGAGDVIVGYEDSYISDLRIQNSNIDMLKSFPKDIAARRNDYLDGDTCFLALLSPTTFTNNNIDVDKRVIYSKTAIKACKKYREAHNASKVQWTAIGAANPKWATTVFPELVEDEALLSLWNAILSTMRVNGDGKSEERWKKHISDLHSKCDYLNNLNLVSLHYKNSIGTDLEVKLPKNNRWHGADTTTVAGFDYAPNMPTEEVYNVPDKYGVNGTVVSSKDLILDNTTVKGLRFVLKDGKIIEEYAESGLEAIKHHLQIDEGASHLGEAALVPYDSTISNLDILFYNTLFDENAACHFAFGLAFPECVDNGMQMSVEERDAAGLNFSNTHVDFMVGTPDLEIIGTTESGEKVPIFKNGNYAF